MFRLVRYKIHVRDARDVYALKSIKENYLTDGNFFITLTTIFVAIELCAGVSSIELCSNKSTEM